MKTIKQVAKELDITTQAVYKKINQTLKYELKNHIHTQNNKRFIDDEGFVILKSSLQTVANELQTDNQLNIKHYDLKKCLQKEFLDKNTKCVANGLQHDYNELQTTYENENETTENTANKRFANDCNQDATDEIINILKGQITDLKERLNASQNTIDNLAQTIRNQQDANNQQMYNLQVLLKQEQEKNAKLLVISEDIAKPPKENIFKKWFNVKSKTKEED